MPRRADQIDRLMTILRIHLPHYPLYMIFYGKFRQIHVSRDFLVGQSLCHKVHQLELAVGQSVLVRPEQ